MSMCNAPRPILCLLVLGFAVLLLGCNSSAPSSPAASSGAPTATGSAPSGSLDYLSPVARARMKAQEIESMNNLKQIGIAFHNFHDVYGVFPDQTGTPNTNSK